MSAFNFLDWVIRIDIFEKLNIFFCYKQVLLNYYDQNKLKYKANYTIYIYNIFNAGKNIVRLSVDCTCEVIGIMSNVLKS